MTIMCHSSLYFTDEQPPRTRDELIHQMLRHRWDKDWLVSAIEKLRNNRIVGTYTVDHLYTYLHSDVCHGTYVTDAVVLAAFADNEREKLCTSEDQAQYSAKNAKL